MSKPITMQTHHVLIIALVIIALIIALIFLAPSYARQPPYESPPKNEEKPDTSGAWIQDGAVVPISSELKRFLADRQVEKLALINNKGVLMLKRAADGKDVEFCGRIVGTEVKNLKGKNCHLENVTHINQLLVLRIEGGNPHPGTCGSSGGNVGC